MATSKRTTRRTGAKSDNGSTSQENGGTPPENAAAPAENGTARHAGREITPAARPRSRKAKTPAGGERAPASRRSDDRHATIARAAYFRSQSRGFQPGFELEDWLAAEAEVDAGSIEARRAALT
jgi:hypothetical protein